MDQKQGLPGGESAELNPSVIFETLNAFQNSAALAAAIELDLFSAIAAGANTASTLASQVHADERGIRIVCDFLTVRGYLTKANGTYGLPPISAAFLDRKSPSYFGATARFVHSADILEAHRHLAQAIRTGTTQLKSDGTIGDHYEGWVEFARSMGPMMMPAAKFMAEEVAKRKSGPMRVLDLAAGHGCFGIAIAQAIVGTTIVALDWPAVLEVAREHAAAAQVKHYEAIPGSAFDADFGSGYDVILITNFLHHFPRHECVQILRKANAALAPGGIILTLEFIPNEDRVSPPPCATFALTMLATTPAGDAYTLADYQSMWNEVAPRKHELFDVPGTPLRLMVSS